jgi:hypothetical protein
MTCGSGNHQHSSFMSIGSRLRRIPERRLGRTQSRFSCRRRMARSLCMRVLRQDINVLLLRQQLHLHPFTNCVLGQSERRLF